MDLGFENLGYEILFINDNDVPFMEAHLFSRKKMGLKPPLFGTSLQSIDWFLEKDGKKFLVELMEKAKKEKRYTGFIGGPPCPDFSVGGKNRGRHGDNGRLSESYMQLICAQKPDWFLFENVKGLWKTKKHREFYEHLKTMVKSSGYIVSEQLINSIQFGAPQDRYRILLFGIRSSLFTPAKLKESINSSGDLNFPWGKYMKYPGKSAFALPWPATNAFGSTPHRPDVPIDLTVAGWFDKNMVDKHPNAIHFFKARAGLKRFQSIQEGDDSKKSYKRLHRWRYSPTVCYGHNEVHLHPWEPRRLTVAEAMALQSLPSDFVLPATMSLSSMFKTIGNGVPYLMAYGIAKTIKEYLSNLK